LVGILLVAVLVVSLFIVQNASKPSPTPTRSPAPTVSSTPTVMASSSPSSPGTSAAPSATPSSPVQIGSPTSLPYNGLFPGEVTQYDGVSLTPVYAFLDDIIQHPDVAIDGTQNVDVSTYRLNITGLVNQPKEYTYSDVINNFTSYQNVATLLCVEGWSITCLWQGVLISDLINAAGVSPNANTLIFTATDGYTTALPINYVEQNNITLAYKMNNVTLPAAAGYPFMLVPSDQYGYKWIKWVTEIDVSNDSSYLGYWESQGYPNNATVTGPSGIAPFGISLPALGTVVLSGALITAVVVAVYGIIVRKRKNSKNANQEKAG